MWYSPFLPSRGSPQPTRCSLRFRAPAFASRHGRTLWRLVYDPPPAVCLARPQVVDMRHRDIGQPFVGSVLVHLMAPPEQMPGGGARQALVGSIDAGQKLDIGLGIALRKLAPARGFWLQLSRLTVFRNQPRYLSPPVSRYPHQVAPKRTPGLFRLLAVPARQQDLAHDPARFRRGARLHLQLVARCRHSRWCKA